MAKAGSATLGLLAMAVASVISNSILAQGGLNKGEKNAGTFSSVVGKVELIDGPYTYKGATDVLPSLGWKVVDASASPGQEDVKFRLCDGTVRTVKASALVRVHRNCPSGSPVGPWVAYGTGIAPANQGATVAAEKKIDLNQLPAAYRDIVASSKEGEVVGYTFHSGTGTNLGILKRLAPQF